MYCFQSSLVLYKVDTLSHCGLSTMRVSLNLNQPTYVDELLVTAYITVLNCVKGDTVGAVRAVVLSLLPHFPHAPQKLINSTLTALLKS